MWVIAAVLRDSPYRDTVCGGYPQAVGSVAGVFAIAPQMLAVDYHTDPDNKTSGLLRTVWKSDFKRCRLLRQAKQR